MRIDRLFHGTGAALLAVGMATAGGSLASATFPGSDGDLVWASNCAQNTNGQQLFSASYTATNEQCPASGVTAPYNTVTRGFDSMPYFSADGNTVYFARRVVGAQTAIESLTYPNTYSGTGPDGATQLTTPASGQNDFAPTVSADGRYLAFVRCDTSAPAGCFVWVQGLNPASAAVEYTAAQTTAADTSGYGTMNRPEFDPADSSDNLIAFVGTAGGGVVDLFNRSTNAVTNLSAATGIPTGALDEHPDWSPDGDALVFDSTRPFYAPSDTSHTTNLNQGHAVFVMANPTGTPTVTQRWNGAVAGVSQIEPVYEPATAAGTAGSPSASDLRPMLAWISEGSGNNVQVVSGTSVNPSSTSDHAVTSTLGNNIQVIWRPLTPAVSAPETPLALALPIAGAALLFGAGAVARRRSVRSA